MNGRELSSAPACVLWSLVKCGSSPRGAGEVACGEGDSTQGCENNGVNTSSMEAIITGLLRSRRTLVCPLAALILAISCLANLFPRDVSVRCTAEISQRDSPSSPPQLSLLQHLPSSFYLSLGPSPWLLQEGPFLRKSGRSVGGPVAVPRPWREPCLLPQLPSLRNEPRGRRHSAFCAARSLFDRRRASCQVDLVPSPTTPATEELSFCQGEEGG